MRFSGLLSFGAALCCATDSCLLKRHRRLSVYLSVCLSVCLCAKASLQRSGVTKANTDCFLFQWAATGSGNILVVWRRKKLFETHANTKNIQVERKNPFWLFLLIILSAVCQHLVFCVTPSSRRRGHVVLRFACWIKESSSAAFIPLTFDVAGFGWWPCCVRWCVAAVSGTFQIQSSEIYMNLFWLGDYESKHCHWKHKSVGATRVELKWQSVFLLWGSGGLALFLCRSPTFIQPLAPGDSHVKCKVKPNIEAS